jgi:alkanesulfonate monooxygenase
MAMRFHWRLPLGGEISGLTRAAISARVTTGLPDLDVQTQFCLCAEENGIDSLLIDFGSSKPDSILLAAALGRATEKIKLIVAYRSGLASPTAFVQQTNTLSALIGGRFSLNIVAGHSPDEQRAYGDFLDHDQRYARTEEFLSICHAFWNGPMPVNFSGTYYRIENAVLNTPFVSSERAFPEIFIGGSSTPAQQLAIKHGTCWMRLADTPEKVRCDVRPVLAAGKEAGLRLSIVARPTREEAVQAAYSLVAGVNQQSDADFVKKSDSTSITSTYELAQHDWLTPWLWAGAVRALGAPSMAIVGNPEQVASAIMEYSDAGITHFIFSGWPKLDAMSYFGQEILPLIRAAERAKLRQRQDVEKPAVHQ